MKVEIIGSFLPPERLSQARDALRRGAINRKIFNGIVDDAVSELVNHELTLGLPQVTTGEFRREHWDMDFWSGFNGITKACFDSGLIYQNVETGCDLLRIVGRIRYNPAHPFFDDMKNLKNLVGDYAVCMQCLPSPADLYLAVMHVGGGDILKVYPDKYTLFADITEAYRLTLQKLYQLGCRSVQFDDTACGRLCQDNFTKHLLQGGIDLMGLHAEFISLINDSLKEVPSDMETSLYLSGGDIIVPEWEYIEYPDNIMPKVLKYVQVDKFFLPMRLDYDYQVEILRHVPEGKKIVLGLTDAHSPYPEDYAKILHIVSMARQYISSDKITVSPRTGFKLTNHHDRGLTYEDQWKKIIELQQIVESIER